MCDTLVALPQRTASGNIILGKNSDREPLEAQAILHVPHRFPSEKEVRCTYISIPQEKETFEVILSKPFQMWGAEMGVNEFGLVIGNEAVFTNVKFNKKEIGLTGMDLLRLALERCKTAREALKTIATLLKQHGQNACGGYQNKSFYYHNSFLIADTKEAFIFETAGKSWAYRQIDSLGSISNGLTISDDYEEVHWGKEPRTLQKLFTGKSGNFRNYFSDLLYTTAGKASKRQACTLGFLEKKENLSVLDFFEAMRQHNLPQEVFDPKKANTGSICMHATGFTNPSDTTGSMVAEIRKERPSTIWLSATSYPCLSLYLPFYFGNSIDTVAFSPGANPDESMWWKAKKVHQIILENYQKLQPDYRSKLDEIQKEWLKKDVELIENDASKEDLSHFTNSCFEYYLEILQDFIFLKK
jgi:dipeptidase